MEDTAHYDTQTILKQYKVKSICLVFTWLLACNVCYCSGGIIFMCVSFPRLSLVLSPNLKMGIFTWENTMIGLWVSWHKIDWLNQRKKCLCVANAVQDSFCIQYTRYH